MGWLFTSPVTLGLPSWWFDFSMTFWLLHDFSNSINNSWTSTLCYISNIFKLHNPQMMTHIHLDMKSLQDMIWHWWHGLHDDIAMSSHSCCCYLSVFLKYGTCSSSSSSIRLEGTKSSMRSWSPAIVAIWCPFVFLDWWTCICSYTCVF